MARLKHALQFATSIFALSLSSLATLTRAGAQTAGSVGAVNPAATGTPAGGSARSLVIGSSVVRNERLQTSPTGTLHVTFNDKTTLNLAPSTTLVIDNYVYDPSSDSGTLQASLRSGLMRFVGGAISHKTGATLTTPVATIGIRGNMVIVEHIPTCGWQITSLAQGEISVSNRVSERRITRPGYTVCVASADQIIPEPTRANPAAISQAFDATLSRSGQTGGATRPPTDAGAARGGVGSAPLPSISGSPLDALSPFAIQRGIGRNSAQGRQPRQVVPAPPANPYGSN
jgi:hypothetical protein